MRIRFKTSNSPMLAGRAGRRKLMGRHRHGAVVGVLQCMVWCTVYTPSPLLYILKGIVSRDEKFI
jgi:hypothetical protein